MAGALKRVWRVCLSILKTVNRSMEPKMDDKPGGATPPSVAELDDATLAFAQKVFQLARSGDAATLRDLLEHRLPPNLCNHRGDNLLMLASYHGHLDAARALLEHGADPEMRNDM